MLAQAAQLCDFVHPCSAAQCQARKTEAYLSSHPSPHLSSHLSSHLSLHLSSYLSSHLSPRPPHSSRHFPVRSLSVLISQVSVARNWTALCLSFPIFKMGIINPALA